MLIQFNADNHVQAHPEQLSDLEKQLAEAFSRYTAKITRLEVYLKDVVGGDRSGEGDKRCTMELHMSGYEPLAVTHSAQSITVACNGARDKLLRTLERRLGRLRNPKAHDRTEQRLNP